MVFDNLEAKLDLDSSGFKRGVESAQSSLNDLSSRTQRAGKTMQSAGSTMTRGISAPLAAAGAASVKFAADFDSSMQESMAIMGDVDKTMRDKMEKRARSVAKTTTFSAEQAADSYYYLASAGLDASESMNQMGTVAEFAQAGMFDMSQATDILTDANSALGRETKNMVGLSDQLVQANQQANASVEQFGTALTSKAAPAMRRLGVESEEGISALSVFADQGLKGERAGTILARSLGGLEKAARKNSGALEKLGVSVTNAQGELRPMQKIVADLESATEGMSTAQRNAALSQLGLNKRAQRGIDMLMGNSEALGQYKKNLEGAGGSAEDVADKQLNSFSGQLSLLKSQLKDVAISIGQEMLPALRKLTSVVSGATTAFEGLNQSQRRLVIAVGGIVAAIGPLLIVGGKLVTLVGTLAPVFATLAGALSGPVLVAVVGLVAAVGALFVAWQKNLFGIRDVTRDVLGKIQSAVMAALPVIRSAITGFLQAARAFWNNHLKGILQTTVAVFGQVLDAVAQVMNFMLNEAIRPMWAEIKALWKRHGQAILTETVATFQSIWSTVQPAMTELLALSRTILGHMKTAWQRWKKILIPLVKGWVTFITTTIAGAMDTVLTAVRVALALLRGDWKKALDLTVGLTKRNLQRIKTLFTNSLNTLKAVVSGFVDALIGLAQDLYNGFTNEVSNMTSAVTSAVDDMADAALSTVRDLPGDFRDAGADMVSSLADGITDNIPDVKGAASSAVGSVRSRLPGSDADEGPLSDLTDSAEALPATLAKGMRDGSGDVGAAADALASEASPGAADAVAGGPRSSASSGAGQRREAALAQAIRTLPSRNRKALNGMHAVLKDGKFEATDDGLIHLIDGRIEFRNERASTHAWSRNARGN